MDGEKIKEDNNTVKINPPVVVTIPHSSSNENAGDKDISNDLSSNNSNNNNNESLKPTHSKKPSHTASIEFGHTHGKRSFSVTMGENVNYATLDTNKCTQCRGAYGRGFWNLFSLTFQDRQLETEYQDYFTKKILKRWKLFLILSTVFFNIGINVLSWGIYTAIWNDRYLTTFPCGSTDYHVTSSCINTDFSTISPLFAAFKEHERCSLYELPKSDNNHILFLILGAVVPFLALFGGCLYFEKQNLFKKYHVLPYASSFYCLVSAIVNVILFQGYVARTNCWISETAAPLIMIVFMVHVCMKIRFKHSIIIGLVVIAAFIGTGIAIDRIQTPYVYVLALTMGFVFCCISYMAYEQEKHLRDGFLHTRSLFRANKKLAYQLDSLQKQFGQDAINFQSPLEKATALIKSVAATSNLDREQFERLHDALALLASSNVQSPDLESQIKQGILKVDAEQEIWIYQQISHRASTAGIVNSAHGSKNRLASSSIQGLAGASHTPRKSLTFTRRDSMHLPHGRSHSQELHDGKMQIKLLPALLNGNTGSGSSDGTVYSSSTMGHLVSEQIFNTCRFTAKQLKDMEALLSTIEQWNFDIFALSEITNGWTLTVLGYFLFKRCGLIESLNLPVDKFSRFLMRLERGYHDDLPYHNSIHAADVLHAIHYFTQLDTIHKVLSDLDIFAMFFAAMVHDHDHPGVNNNFLINTRSERATLYNDRSVLENHHLSTSFALLTRDETNFISHFSPEDYKSFRRQVVEMVLATDLANHFGIVSKFRQQVKECGGANGQETYVPQTMDDKILLYQMCIKAADVSNPAKEWDIYSMWTGRILEEFYRQGDKEKLMKLPISPFMDRDNANVPSSQLGFIDFICTPLFEALDLYAIIPDLMKNLSKNKQKWVEDKAKSEGTASSSTTSPPVSASPAIAGAPPSSSNSQPAQRIPSLRRTTSKSNMSTPMSSPTPLLLSANNHVNSNSSYSSNNARP